MFSSIVFSTMPSLSIDLRVAVPTMSFWTKLKEENVNADSTDNMFIMLDIYITDGEEGSFEFDQLRYNGDWQRN